MHPDKARPDGIVIGSRILAAVCGATLIATARLIAGEVSWLVGWGINAMGWILLAAVVIPLSDRMKRPKGGRE